MDWFEFTDVRYIIDTAAGVYVALAAWSLTAWIIRMAKAMVKRLRKSS